MRKHVYALNIAILLMFFCLLLSSCGSSTANDAALTSAALGEASRVAQPSATHTDQKLSGTSNSYAFVRDEQLWVALNGAKPVQATHFDYSSVGGTHANVFWNQPLWFDNDHYVAFELKALQGGLGGGGCGFVSDYSRLSSLYVLNTTTMRITKITVPGEQEPATNSQYDGYWEYLFTEDTTHLLTWHFVTGNTGGLYRYDFKTGTLTLAVPASSVPDADSNHEAYSPMRYSHGQLYYEVMKNVSGQVYNYAIYSYSVAHPNTSSVKVLDAGTQVFCDVDHNNWGLFRELGWDISPDGQQLAAQKIIKDNQGKVTSTIQLVALKSGTVTPLFPQLAPTVVGHDLALSWAPDNQTILLQSSALQSSAQTQGPGPGPVAGQGTFYSTTLAAPSVVQTYPYTTNLEYHIGHIFWKPASTTFALYAFQEGSSITNTNIYTFTIGKTQAQVLLTNATSFAWS